MRGSAGVPPFSHHMDASEGAVFCFSPPPLSAISPNSSSVFFGYPFFPSLLEDFLSSLFGVICEPVLFY